MIKNLTAFQTQIEDKAYSFYCEPTSTINHVKEALFQISKMIGQIEESIAAQQKAAEEKKEEAEPAPDAA